MIYNLPPWQIVNTLSTKRMDDSIINFYLPYHKDGITSIPEKIEDYWSWISTIGSIGEGKYSWTLQTYLNLAKTKLPCRLVSHFPEKGIVISHKDFLPVFLIPKPEVFLVCIKPDRKEHSCAHFYLVQNKNDKIFNKFTSGRVAEIPFWPQPSLKKRNIDRGSRCTNIAYVGRLLNLAKELQEDSWNTKLQELGFNWKSLQMDEWNDYSNIDLTISVRDFGNKQHSQNPVFDPDSKPPAKLINSWLAGVPSIVGRESAYQNIKESDLDFIEVETSEQLLEEIITLSKNTTLYQQMVVHGLARAKDYSTEAVVQHWQRIIQELIQPAHEEWKQLSTTKKRVHNLSSASKYYLNRQNALNLFTILFKEFNKVFTRVLTRSQRK